jgi:glycosyltransferase involved in cell wall biosynthesis
MEIAILLSTYNGEKYISDQLQSIISQSYTDWKLYIRDDGSFDNTNNIINNYKGLHPDKIFIINDNLGKLNSAKSFMTLLKNVESDFYMFCDQDDIWVYNKIELSLAKILNLQKLYGNVPALVFTDLIVVDENLKVLNSSLWNYSKIDPEHIRNFYKLATNSSVTGCTIIINDLLKKSSLPIPSRLLMHDWWLGLLACRVGVIDYITSGTVLYRQHSLNVLGAEPTSVKTVNYKLRHFKKVLEKNIDFLLMIMDKRLNTNLFALYYFKLRKIFSL